MKEKWESKKIKRNKKGMLTKLKEEIKAIKVDAVLVVRSTRHE